jgi:RNA polymerase sigma-70 factor, ECF subfamily
MNTFMPKKREQEYVKLYDQFADAIFRFCLFKTSNRQLALDLTQETFIRLWSYMVAREDGIDNPKALLYTIARNIITDEYRRKSEKHESLDTLVAAGFDPHDTTTRSIDTDLIASVLELFDRLTDEDREILTMRFVDDLSIPEIATVLSVKDNTVSVRIHRALARVKELVEETT